MTLTLSTPATMGHSVATNPMGLLLAAMEVINIMAAQMGSSSSSSRLTRASRVTVVITLHTPTSAVVTRVGQVKAVLTHLLRSPAMVLAKLGLDLGPRDIQIPTAVTTSMAWGLGPRARDQEAMAGIPESNTVSLGILLVLKMDSPGFPAVPSMASLVPLQAPTMAHLGLLSVPMDSQGRMHPQTGRPHHSGMPKHLKETTWVAIMQTLAMAIAPTETVHLLSRLTCWLLSAGVSGA